PKVPKVDAGDTVRWISFQGDVTVTFPRSRSPFAGRRQFKARKGTLTSGAIVRPRVPIGKHFGCTIAVGPVVDKRASGVDTPGSERGGAGCDRAARPILV